MKPAGPERALGGPATEQGEDVKASGATVHNRTRLNPAREERRTYEMRCGGDQAKDEAAASAPRPAVWERPAAHPASARTQPGKRSAAHARTRSSVFIVVSEARAWCTIVCAVLLYHRRRSRFVHARVTTDTCEECVVPHTALGQPQLHRGMRIFSFVVI